LYKNKNKASKY